MRLKAAQLRDMTDEELAQKKGTVKKEIFELRYQARMGRVDKPHRVSEARREIARIETILSERRREGGPSGQVIPESKKKDKAKR